LSEQLDIFGEESGVPLNVAMKRRRSAPGWQLAPHCCKFCFGRVLSRSVSGVVIEVRCAECGEHAQGPAEEICACGADCGDIGFVLKCVRNPNVTKENPHEVLIREVLRPVEQKEQRVVKSVRLGDF
jgi:ribosomal protein L37AE/L43A